MYTTDRTLMLTRKLVLGIRYMWSCQLYTLLIHGFIMVFLCFSVITKWCYHSLHFEHFYRTLFKMTHGWSFRYAKHVRARCKTCLRFKITGICFDTTCFIFLIFLVHCINYTITGIKLKGLVLCFRVPNTHSFVHDNM